MKYYELDKEEKEIADAVDKDKVNRIENFTEEKKSWSKQPALLWIERKKLIFGFRKKIYKK